MRLLINRDRLLNLFEYEPSLYKGIKIGDRLIVPQEQMQNISSLFVIVTGFNREHDIVHWRGHSVLGGQAHSGSYYDDILMHFTCI
jgi:hypothetical protein